MPDKFLFEEVLTSKTFNVSADGARGDNVLQTLQIKRIPFTFESLDDEHVKQSLNPPVLLRPISLEIAEKHPIDTKYEDPEDLEQLEFRDYDPPADLEGFEAEAWNTEACARLTAQYMHSWAYAMPQLAKHG
ncbi:hypothetical protein MW887_000523 [Aspergillus wentii]|nr:hypothetical protein MW887_000523 [Aspergillus wentii]